LNCLDVEGKNSFRFWDFFLFYVVLILSIVCLLDRMLSVVMVLVSRLGLWYIIVVIIVSSLICLVIVVR